jgi:hypothetical protein
MFGKGYGGGRIPGSLSCGAVGHVIKSNKDGTNLSGSKDGQQGYNWQSPRELKVVWSVSCNDNKTL